MNDNLKEIKQIDNNNKKNLVLEILDRLEDVINDAKENDIIVNRIKNIIMLLNDLNDKYEKIIQKLNNFYIKYFLTIIFFQNWFKNTTNIYKN